jgi:hypothetical protein
MNSELANLLSAIFTGMGLTILFVWPEHGPTAWIRDNVIRPTLPAACRGVLDCYVCFGFWAGLLVGALWWWQTRQFWCWSNGFMVSAALWICLRVSSSSEEVINEQKGGSSESNEEGVE